MAKDDYDVIACKMMVFFYKKLKRELSEDDLKYYMYPLTSQFPINEEYFNAVLLDLFEAGYIADLAVTRAWGGDIVNISIDRARITLKGAEYLSENSKMKEIAYTIKEAIPIIGLFA